MYRIWRNSLGNIGRTFFFIYRHSPRWTILHIFTSVIMGILPLGLIYLIKLLVDEVTRAVEMGPSGTGMEGVLWIILATGVVFFLNSALGSWVNYIKEKHTRQIEDLMFEKIHHKAPSLDLAYYENPHHHDVIFRAEQESRYRPQQIITGLITVIQNTISLLTVALMLSFLNWIIILVLAVAVLPAVYVKFRYNIRNYRMFRQHTEDLRKTFYFNRLLTEKSFAKELRLFGLAPYFRAQFVRLRDKIWSKKSHLLRSKTVWETLSHLLAALAIFGAFAWLTRDAIRGDITIGSLVMYFLVIRRGFTFLKSLLDGFSKLYEQNLFLDNLFEFLDLQPRITVSSSRRLKLEEPIDIRLEGVAFRYPETERMVLEDLNMHIPAGKTVAFVGENGAGKTTLIKLLCRFYDPVAGTIRFNGNDIRTIIPGQIRRHLSVLFQDYIQYHLTAGENIWFGNTGRLYDESFLSKAAGMAGIRDNIQSFPRGYDTYLGNLFTNSSELSIGEWQKLAMARTYFRNAGLYILDEPTSAMDAETEQEVFTRFREMIEGKTAIIISHRFTTISMADYIYVLDNHTVREEGTHQELMEQDGRYARLYRAQARHFQ
jgi:ATP-binding cassette subfamily B protein